MKISILGSTGSIGKATLNVIDSINKDKDCRVVALAAGKNFELLSQQIEAYKPDLVSVADDNIRKKLAGLLPLGLDSKPEILVGDEGLEAVATHPDAAMVMNGLVGAIGLKPTLAAIELGRPVALANKETLVMAGELVMAKAHEHSAPILPVDSEHSGIFQIIDGRPKEEFRKLILCASGGPFLDRDVETFKDVTVEEALDHPVWKMGPKISVDSATLMNKGLEVIEAHWLFDASADSIEVLIHPQGIVHSMVEFVDGSVLAHLAVPNMEGPIAHALLHPKRHKDALSSLDLASIGELSFSKVDTKKFPALKLAYDALKAGGSMPCALNAANEVAVAAFLDRKIPFTRITEVVDKALSQHNSRPIKGLDHAIEADQETREMAQKFIRR